MNNEGLLAVIPARRFASPVLISSVAELASSQLDWRLLVWISNVKLPLVVFFSFSPLSCEMYFDIILGCPSSDAFQGLVYYKFFSSEVSKTYILWLVIIFTRLKHWLRYSRSSNFVLHFSKAPCMAVIQPVIYRFYLFVLSLFHPK